jgi:lipoprotein-releasing system ATP-binding protein
LLSADGLHKSYETPRGPLVVLDGVSLRLEPGESLAVVGPSGSGKSTLLYVLGGLEAPDSGRVSVSGVDPYALRETELAAFRNRRVGFVFQDHCLLPQLTVLENVLLPTLAADQAPGSAPERARQLIQQVGLEDRIEHRPSELSGGEKQRVALARALVLSPSLLLCDEPTGNLDRVAADNVASVLLDLHALKKTILLVVTHSAQLAEKLPVRFDLIDNQLRRQSL